MKLRTRHTGFSLIELVVTMLITAILAAAAIPAYSNYVRKLRRTDAKSGLLNLAASEKRYFLRQHAYSSHASDLGYTAFPMALGSGEYSVAAINPIAATTTTPATYSITAVAVGDQLKDTQCASFTITSSGLQTSQDSSNQDTSAVCWK